MPATTKARGRCPGVVVVIAFTECTGMYGSCHRDTFAALPVSCCPSFLAFLLRDVVSSCVLVTDNIPFCSFRAPSTYSKRWGHTRRMYIASAFMCFWRWLEANRPLNHLRSYWSCLFSNREAPPKGL